MGGFFGTISKGECINDLFYGTDYNSHMGTKRGGLATWTEKGIRRSIHNLENSYFRGKFEDDLDKFTGKSGIGVISDTDPQPIVMNSHLGKYAVVTVAKINNLDELEKRIIDSGGHFSELSSGETNPTELVALLLNEGKTFAEGIRNVLDSVKGSCTMLILTEDGIIAMRDKLGRLPVILGKKEGAMAVSNEPCGFPNLGYEIEYNLKPGEAVKITADGYERICEPGKKKQICSFLWVYYGYPVSEYEGINVDMVRYKGGYAMAKDDDLDVDFVAGIPDSGVGHALGYAVGKGVPYKRAFIKYTPTWPRSFTPSRQEQREFIAKMKLIPNKTLLKDQRVIFCDDSIVRGTQLRDNVNILYDYGAKEVHMRIACPPLLYGCPFLNFTASKSALELIARRIIKRIEGEDDKNLDLYKKTDSEQYNRLVDEIRKELNITTLKFNSLENLVEAIGLKKEELCTHCWDGTSCF
ncbi:amidophosphoribosyltransferase [Paludibacter sp. 221]|uniref:amidophosphoribosyltransferase n=1 Tax=Paludibacter sp. 221 TaxID=2302939 RepID=UPI0013CF8F34|nr:amidophosphoribosyltransferase [Paludibacter sp. 221]NDV47333.1 amidophosphoribosyltransferase [Paludibacter sp. 221]